MQSVNKITLRLTWLPLFTSLPHCAFLSFLSWRKMKYCINTLFKELLANTVCDYNTTHRLTIKGAENKDANEFASFLTLVLQETILQFNV